MNILPITEFDRDKENDVLTKEYMNSMVTCFKTKYPDLSEDDFREVLKEDVKQKLKRPKARVLDYPTPGNVEDKEIDLLNLCNNFINDYIITPAGTLYQKASKKRSFISKYIGDRLKMRKKYKNESMDHEAKGESLLAKLKDYIQSRIKIFVNAISGAMKSAHNALFDPAGYAAITSIARHACMTAYAHAERFLENNFYFPTEDDLINWLVLTIRHCPNEVELNVIVHQYSLHIPSPIELANSFIESIENYKVDIDKDYIYSFTDKMPEHQRVFAYYCYNMHNLFRKNDFAKGWMDSIFRLPEMDQDELDKIDPQEGFKLDEDLLILANTVHHKLIEDMLLADAIKERPDLARQFIYTARYIDRRLRYIQPLFDMFFSSKIDVPNAISQKNLMRKTVILSDTDSIIFTVANWVKWRLGRIEFTPEAFNTSALMVYMLSKSLANVFASMSMNMGMEGPNLRAINMKTELTYPLMIRTPMSKHYISTVIFREGRKLPKPKKDIKGKNLRGSEYGRRTLDFMEKLFLEDILDTYERDLELSAYDLIRKVTIFEKKIKHTTLDGDDAFLQTSNMNMLEHYKDPLKSKYFHYMVWEEVFSDKYGKGHLPSQYKILPISTITHKKSDQIEYIKDIDPKIYEKLMGMLSKYPNKKLHAVYIPAASQIPEELIPIIDYRKIIHQKCFGIYIVMRSFNIGLMFDKKVCLFTDMYGEPELTEDEYKLYEEI